MRGRVKGPKRKKTVKVTGGPVVVIPGIRVGMAAKALQGALAAFLASAIGRELASQARNVLPGPVRERVTDEELMREVERWMREQAKTPAAGKKGLAVPLGPVPPPARGRRGIGPILGPRRQVGPLTAPQPVLEQPRPTRRDEEPPDEETFAAWFERRFARSIVRNQRLGRRRTNGRRRKRI